MRAIYTRKFGVPAEIPPGYRGSAFNEVIRDRKETKDNCITEALPIPETDGIGESDPGTATPESSSPEQKRTAKESFGQLLELIRGKIGTEELILTLVLLLISSDEVGAETVILVLALLAG